jgi:tetratricopeptide (TPR) repeat protein
MKNNPAIDKNDIAAEIAQAEKFGLGDLIIAAVLAAATFIGLTVWSYPSLSPTLWQETAVAAGVRPAASVLPGYFTFAASVIHSIFGANAAPAMMRFLSHIFLALIAVLVYATIREMLVFIMRARPQRSARRSLVVKIASFVGTVAFICTDPVWMAGQSLSETTILIALTLGAIEFYFIFLRKGAIRYAYICAVMLGLLAAESPMGFIFLAAFVALNFVVLKVLPILESPFFRPEVIAVGKWYMTFIFMATFIAGVLLNCWTFVAHGGLDAIGESVGYIPLEYLLAYWGRLSHAADLTGWIMLIGACLTPFVVTIVRFPSASDEEVFLSYSTGMVFLFCGVVAILQSGPIPELWFWTYAPNISPYLLSVGVLLAAVTVAGGVMILGVDSLCRDHLHLAIQQFGADDDDVEAPQVTSRLSTLIRRTGMVVIPVILVLLMLPGRQKTATRAALALIRDALAEIIVESGDAEYMFSDGNLDTAIELCSHRDGGSLKCLSMMGGGSPYKVYLRTRGLTDDKEDKFSFTFDAAMGLRSWIRDRPQKLGSCVIQLGHDLWKRDGKAIPPVGGIISRPLGWPDDSERIASVERGRALAERALEICSKGLKDCTDKDTRRAFWNVLWRLSRACTYRGERADIAGDAANAIAEAELAAKLNDVNETYKEMIQNIRKQSDRMSQQLTTREGLQLALVRADFTMGKLYAETILSAEPDNADANFAMGMYYLKERQLTRAEEYLKRCLLRKPNEPAVYNNLAMIQLELGKLDAAEVNVAKALRLIPDSAAVQDTQNAIQRAREAQSQKK